MNTAELCINDARASFTTPDVNLIGDFGPGLMSIQVRRSVAASVQLQGRNHPTHQFVNLGSAITATGITNVVRCAEVRAVVSGNTGLVDIGIAY